MKRKYVQPATISHIMCLENQFMDMSISVGDDLTDPVAEIKDGNSWLSPDRPEKGWSDDLVW